MVLVLLATLLLPAVTMADVSVLSRQSNGVPSFVAGDLGRIDTAGSKSLSSSAAVDVMRGILLTHFDAVGDEEMTVMRSRVDQVGDMHVRFQQTYNGLPVVGAEMYLHAHAGSGEVFAVNGEFVPGRDLPFSPAVGAEEALTKALRFAGIRGERLDTPALTYVRADDGQAYLAWQVTMSYVDSEGLVQRDVVFADAMTGQMVARHPQIFHARSLRTYTANNGTSTPGSLVSSSSNTISTGDAAIDAAHNNAIATYNYYSSAHGRDGINGSGGTIISTAHYSSNYNNAYWDGTQMVYGDGDGSTFIPLSEDADVVGHELTHGVTSNESNLTYSGESGAMNESLSDIFGAMVDRYTGATGNDIWKVGEDIYTPGTSGDALRYMYDPTIDGSSSDYYPDRYTGSQDNGGVHWNSGISNLAFYLLVNGGTHPRGKTSNTVPGIGFTAAADIFYYANTSCLTSGSNFQAFRNCTSAGATALYGATEEAAVQEAWDAVGVPGGSGGGGGGGGGGGCTGTNVWTGTASSSSTNLYTPNCSASGTFNGQLSCDNGSADLDLYLQKESCSGWFGCSFSSVASSTSAGCDESVSGYSGSSGTYRWRINWYSGPSEPFHLCTNKC